MKKIEYSKKTLPHYKQTQQRKNNIITLQNNIIGHNTILVCKEQEIKGI